MAAGKNLSLIGLAVVLACMAYLESPYSFLNENYYVEKDTPSVSRVAVSKPTVRMTEFEYRLVEKLESGGYLIERYEEYEITKDSAGNIINSQPAGTFKEIKYKDYTYRQVP
ncbi:hypothetical protein A8F94_01995 [Bacillus sp. FJAT-27225]|uniref:hypothetical protein n=1 Tax=Bacillus sp. FJAT-27225 TaxID=1743144 RepID=UPI00080C27C8|nr:hypothetical protein [Bacillus sp. FJAT-27225]OCA90673.1 hypothetical protein A8F94_01995 [Bacillus sp. FJAT-27225]